jgi:hypothetical protein
LLLYQPYPTFAVVDKSTFQLPQLYLVVFTIAKRFEPFASVRPTRVTVLLIGAKELIRPVTPAVLVVNKSPSWYVYPDRVICFPLFVVVCII